MRLLVGLGNPGKRYQKTRHNIGFMILDKIAEKRGVVFHLNKNCESNIAQKDKVKLVKPQTFMNESGRAIAKAKNYWKVVSVDIWVVHDDVDLPLGTIRVSLDGSSAGHKGVQSIIKNIGEQFWRLRIGVEKDEKIPTEEWVLMDFPKSDQEVIVKIIDKVAELVLESLSNNIKEQTININ